MLTETDLQELLSYQAQNLVVSLYLNTDPSLGNADFYKLQLRTMLKEVNLAADVSAIEKYFDREFDWTGRSVAVFSCAPQSFFRAYQLAIPVRSRIRKGNQPHVKPLVNLFDFYGGYGVVLVDRQGARAFCFHLGELCEQDGYLGETVRHVKRGGASSVPGRRGGATGRTSNEQEITERNLRDIAGFASDFFTRHNIRRILIGGTDENVAQFRGLLSKSWQSLIVGTFPMSMTATPQEILEKALDIGRQAEFRQEEKLLKTLVTSASKGHGGALDLDATLGAVHDGRVHTLVIREGYRAPGYRCQGCGFVTAQPRSSCPFCSGSFEQIADAVEMAVRSVMQAGGEVEILHSEHKTRGFENIGAILRY